jgi:ketosteroid isomerase-like protein
MNPAETIRRFYRIADGGDYEALVDLLTPDVEFRFANTPASHSAAEIPAKGKLMGEVLARIDHTVGDVITGPDDRHAAVELDVRYTRHDGAVFDVPAAAVFRFTGDGLIDRYRVYIDITPVFA